MAALTPFMQHCTGGLAIAIMQETKKKSIHIGGKKTKLKLFLFSDDMFLYTEKPKELKSWRII